MRQIAGAFAEYEKARLVSKLRHARERLRQEKGKCEGRKPHGELRPGSSDFPLSATTALHQSQTVKKKRLLPWCPGRQDVQVVNYAVDFFTGEINLRHAPIVRHNSL